MANAVQVLPSMGNPRPNNLVEEELEEEGSLLTRFVCCLIVAIVVIFLITLVVMGLVTVFWPSTMPSQPVTSANNGFGG
ncbi:hypothetical protein CRE_04187 [Caenorhabditis remanei]|uniref:Uncharacterized protein n=1 Tax=Caenorhabditis remanei TaxID=31234 RepID=E3MYW2_CAERE|nr:hypothetical protein CRE_04187 [Caenorhabditis remanei]